VLLAVLEKILTDVLHNVDFLHDFKLENGDLQDVNGHVLLNHLLVCQVGQLFNIIVRLLENESLSIA
jgi:hypothetical protein